MVVRDVAELGGDYIACDPRDRSEVVVPCLDAFDELCWGVLDLDSYDTHAFSMIDVAGLTKLLIHAGLLELDEKLRARGGGLIVRHGPAPQRIAALA